MCHHKHLIHDFIYVIIKGNSYSYFFSIELSFILSRFVLFFRIGTTDFTGFYMETDDMTQHDCTFHDKAAF